MSPFLDIWRAGAGRHPRVRPLALALAAILAMVVNLAAPLALQAAPNAGRSGLPAKADAKRACTVLLRDGAATSSQKRRCKEATAAIASFNPITAAGDAISATGGTAVGPVAGAVAGTVTDVLGGAAEDAAGGALGIVGDAVNSTILSGFKAIIDFLFGGLQSAITVALIKWIITIPNLSQGHVGDLEASIAIGAGGLLAATMTISIVRFWGSGLTGDGAWAGAEGIARAAVAAALIGLWPQIFSLAVRLSNALQSGIMGGAVQPQLKALFRDLDVIALAGAPISGGAIPIFLAIVIAIVGILMLLALVAMKIVITALTIVLFCAMPLAFVLWPIPELAGVLRLCLRSLAVLLAIPVVWCLIFGAFAAIGADTFSFHNTGKDEGVFGTLLNAAVVRPLVAISLLYLALVVPRRLLQLAPFMGGGGGGGAVRHIATGAAVRAGFNYAPQAGRAAMGRFQAMGASFGAGAATGQAQPPKPVPNQSPGQAAHSAKAGVAAAPDRKRLPGPASGSSQPPKGKQSSQADGATGQSPDAAAHSAKSRAAAQGGAGGSSGQAGGPRLGGKFNGPETKDLSDAQIEAIGIRGKEMAKASKSGNAVSPAQVDAAFSTLKSQPEFLSAAKAASRSNDPKAATGAFAEWSLSDNSAVTPEIAKAYGDLGRASQPQREEGADRADAGGGPTPTARPPKPGQAQANGHNGSRRMVPASKPNPAGRSISRTPHIQPRGGGFGP